MEETAVEQKPLKENIGKAYRIMRDLTGYPTWEGQDNLIEKVYQPNGNAGKQLNPNY